MDENQNNQPNLEAKPEVPEAPPQSGAEPTPEPVTEAPAGEPNSDDPAQTDTPQPQVVAPQPAAPEKKSRGGLLKILGGLIVVALLALLGYLGWQVFDKAKPAVKSSVGVVKKDVPLLRIGTLEPVNNFYPSTESNIYTDFSVNAQIFEGLVRFQDLTKVVPVLATSWSNPDDTTWVFNLKQGVKFHTGRVMTAKDVKYSLEKYQKTAYGGEFAFGLKSVEVVNDYQVKITTDSPDPLLLHRLAYLAIADSTLAKDGDPMGGTGPYLVKTGTTPSATSLDLVAFDGYHGGHIYAKELKWTSIADQSEDKLTKLTTEGKIDFAMDVENQANADKIKQIGFINISQPTLNIFHIGFNFNKAGSPVQNLKFRQALDAGIDRAALIKAVSLNATPASQIVPQSVPGYNPDIKATPYDQARAKQLLKEAGYPNGTSFTLTYTTVAQDIAENIAQQLKQINVTVKLDPIEDFDAFVAKIFDPAQMESYMTSYGSDLIDASDPIISMFPKEIHTDPALDSLMKSANSTLDQEKRLSELQQASKRLMDQVSWVPIYNRSDNYFYAPSLVIHENAFNSYYFWQVYKK